MTFFLVSDTFPLHNIFPHKHFRALPNTTQPCTAENAHYWYRILEKEVDLVWRPDITFRKIVGIETLTMYGADEKFQLWFCAADNHMEYFQAVKVTFACKFDFTNYPFDYHNCNFGPNHLIL